jgi:regulator of replication initiation timing
MQGENRKFIYNPIIIMSIVVFIVGFGLGFYIWGYHKAKDKDYKEMLKEVITYVDGMERLNADLTKEVDGLKKDNSMLKSPSNAQLVALQSKIQSLQNENTSLRSMAGQSQYLVQENARLNSENQMLRSRLGSSSIPGAQQQGTPQQGTNALTPAPGGQKVNQ